MDVLLVVVALLAGATATLFASIAGDALDAHRRINHGHKERSELGAQHDRQNLGCSPRQSAAHDAVDGEGERHCPEDCTKRRDQYPASPTPVPGRDNDPHGDGNQKSRDDLPEGCAHVCGEVHGLNVQPIRIVNGEHRP